MSDHELLTRLRAGDSRIYKLIFDVHYRNLVKYANRFLNDVECSRDIVQEVFVYLWEKRAVLNIDQALDSYLYRAVHNACINHIKRGKIKSNYIQEFLLRANPDTDRGTQTTGGFERLVEKELSAQIDQILNSLPAQCGNIFKLSRHRGLKNKEIADLYNISTRTVETQIFRALKIFKEKLQNTLIIAMLLKIFDFFR